jgi:hypothetical protein
MSVGPRYDVAKGLERIYKIVKKDFSLTSQLTCFIIRFTLFVTHSLVSFHIFHVVIYCASSVALRENVFIISFPIFQSFEQYTD